MAGAPQKNDPNKALEYFRAKLAFTAGPYDVHNWIEAKEKIAIIDLRDPESYAEGHVPGAVNLPADQWSTLAGLSKDRPNLVYCYSQTCHLAARGAAEFASKGYSVLEMEGGFEAWKEFKFEVEKSLAASAR